MYSSKDQPKIDKFNKLIEVDRYYPQLEKFSLRCLIINADNFSEGVSFRPKDQGVSELIIVNPPSSVSNFIQIVGRPLRACAYPKGSSIKIKMYVAKSKDPDKETVDEKKFNFLKASFEAYNNTVTNLIINDSYDKDKYSFPGEREK